MHIAINFNQRHQTVHITKLQFCKMNPVTQMNDTQLLVHGYTAGSDSTIPKDVINVIIIVQGMNVLTMNLTESFYQNHRHKC